MASIVLLAFVVQAVVGATLAATWWHSGRGGGPTVCTHMAAASIGLGLWIAFVMTGNLIPAWSAFAAITVGNTFGDRVLLARVHRKTGTTSKRRNYRVAVAAILRGRMPWRVAFHALFAGVVYSSCLGVCIASTIAES